MPIQFEKDGPLREFDGFDAKTRYQMVPEAGRREITITTDTECVVEIGSPSIARMANFARLASPPFPTPNPFTPNPTTPVISLPAKAKVRFSLLGVSAGNTVLTVSDRNERLLSDLTISVKTKRVKKYALGFMRDIRRATQRSQAEAQSLMDRVSQSYLAQANVELRLLPPLADIVVPADLGNPFVPSRPGLLQQVLNATPDALTHADIFVYCCWDVEDSGLNGAAGLTTDRFSFVEDGGDPQFTAPLIFAHEVGHALGLDHNGSPDHMMFANTGTRKGKLDQFEIDTLNPSGTVPATGIGPGQN